MRLSSSFGLIMLVIAGCDSDTGDKTENSPPSVQITDPEDATTINEGEEITFTGWVTDDDAEDELIVTWSSSLDGTLLDDAEVSSELTSFATSDLSIGEHQIELVAIDLEGESASDTITVTVLEVNDAPTIEIVHPTASEYCIEGEDFEFIATVADEQDAPEDLLVSFESDLDGIFCEPIPESDGVVSCITSLTGGDHVLTYYVEDSEGLSDEATTEFPCTLDADYDNDGDGYTENEGDCDDGDADIGPEGTETANADDDDCDGIVDESTTIYDDDGDCDCEDDKECTGSVNDECEEYGFGDCDDEDAEVYDGAEESENDIDDDCDDIIDEGTNAYDDDGDGYTENDGDCDDSDSEVLPDATEICDGIDNDCDGDIDDDDGDVDTSTGTTWYADTDGDGYGDADSAIETCEAPSGYVANAEDCDDADSAVSPDATEVCDEIDNDCNGDIDDDDTGLDTSTGTTYYADSDEDGFGDSNISVDTCEVPSGYVENSADCDDADGEVNPDATEVCDEIDNDCNSAIDDDDAGLNTSTGDTFYSDDDGDGFGDADDTVDACEVPSGYVTDATDCDDTDGAVNTDATEVCDDIDNDCDGDIDDDDASVDTSTGDTFYSDSDSDGFGDADSSTMACEQPSGYVSDDSDCDDAAGAVNPDATEICDEIDNDCDGDIDDADASLDTSTGDTFYSDSDGDGFGDPDNTTDTCVIPSGYVEDDSDCDDGDSAVNTDATEICDDIDNDCDGDIDDADSSVDTSTGDEFYADADADGFGDADVTTMSCEVPSGYVADATDCDDSDGAVNTDATEICDDIDNDCNGAIDDDDTGLDTSTGETFYADDDSDGYGDADVSVDTCEMPSGYIDNAEDCDDTTSSINPAADEYCDGVDDEDCDGTVDEDGAVDASTWYQDNDEDGLGVDDTTTVACDQPRYYTDNTDDCDDSDDSLYPFDLYEDTGTYGDSSSDPVNEWSLLSDDGSTTIDIDGYLDDANDEDWYYFSTSQTVTTVGYNTYHVEVEMLDGTDDYEFIVYRDYNSECSAGTYGYTEYDFFAEDVGDGSHSITSAGANGYCYTGSSAYNDCDDFSSSYLVKVIRKSASTDYCATYSLEITNGDSASDRDTGTWDTGL